MDRLEQLFDFSFVETHQLFLAFDDHRAFQQVRIFEHELDRLVFRRRFLFHVPFAIQWCAGIQKRLDGIVADDIPQLFARERVLAVFPFFEIDFLCLQETSCFTASGSRRFINQSDPIGHGLFLLLEEFCDALEGLRIDFVSLGPPAL